MKVTIKANTYVKANDVRDTLKDVEKELVKEGLNINQAVIDLDVVDGFGNPAKADCGKVIFIKNK